MAVLNVDYLTADGHCTDGITGSKVVPILKKKSKRLVENVYKNINIHKKLSMTLFEAENISDISFDFNYVLCPINPLTRIEKAATFAPIPQAISLELSKKFLKKRNEFEISSNTQIKLIYLISKAIEKFFMMRYIA